jgi:D-alanyl-D-alanine carboxypeptidase/D-alanyl-D-alanine-endopeptidase (penicillin-binding protein 4)
VDASLFPEGERELGTNVVLSPVVVNDNLVDVTVTPGAKEGDPTTLTVSPQTGYVTFLSHSKTAAAGAERSLHFGGDVKRSDGTHEVTIEGSLPVGSKPFLGPYRVPQPSVFASVALRESLLAEGTQIAGKPFPAGYASGDVVAEHVSPPLIEEARVLLKVSQNLHASMMPYVVGAVAGHAKDNADQAGFDLEHALLEKAGLDVTAASQSDGAGGDAYFTPDFMVHFLAYMTRQPYFEGYYRALPVLGKDGTLWDIQPNSAAAGFVHAKTGTYATYNALDKNLVITGKGLAGYVTTKSGQKYALAIYANFVPADPQSGTHMVGDALGEIAAAVYDSTF